MDQNTHMSNVNQTIKVPFDDDHDDSNSLMKPRLVDKIRSCHLTSIVLAILFGLLIIIGSVLLVATILRLNICQLQQIEQRETLLGYKPDIPMKTWLSCVKTNISTCTCPVTFIHSSLNPLHCIPTHSHCLHSCKYNLHCKCYNLVDPNRCRLVTQHWITHELKMGPIEHFRKPVNDRLLQSAWTDNFNYQLEHMINNRHSDESLFLSANRRTGFVINTRDQDYLLHERWTKVEINTTQQQIVYTQLDPQTHTCRMSLLNDDGSILHSDTHKCPSSSIVPPYFFGVACRDVLVLWQSSSQTSKQQKEAWALIRHNYESIVPSLPVLLDPFHRYYSLYSNSTVIVKDLNGDFLTEIFTDIQQPTRFEFLDHYQTIWIANHTHMQSFHSTNDQVWLDF